MTRSGPLSRAWRALRSRRLAVVLLLILVAYSFVGTLVPRGAADSPAVREWTAKHPVIAPVAELTGLHRAYSSPVFLAFAALLALSTGACAIERTTNARRMLVASKPLSAASVERLRNAPRFAVRIAPAADTEGVADRARDRLTGLGLAARTEAGVVEGRAGAWGAIGSPLFHWSLFALMVVAALGQATRSEGFMGLPVGDRVPEVHASYLQVVEGPLFGERHSGLEFEATDVLREYVPDGVDVGPAPLVTAYREGIPVASGRVYPNSPLRTGSIMLHMADLGPAATVALENPGGAELVRETIMLDLSEATSSGTEPRILTLTDAGGASAVDVRVQVVVQTSETGTGAAVSRAILETRSAGAPEFGPPVVLTVGDAVTLPGGERLRLAKVGDWVRVSVANDWSVNAIYALFVSAMLGLTIAVFVSVRRVSVLALERDGEWWLHAAAWHSRNDPAFLERVYAALRDAAGDAPLGPPA